MIRARRAPGIFLVLLCIFFVAPYAGAQIVPSSDTALTILLSPEHPQPGDTVTLTLESALHDLSRSKISWRVNGVPLPARNDEETAQVVAGPRGVTTKITVTIIDGQGGASAQAVIAPTRVDLLWESNSYTPPFYQGRGLPSAGTRVIMQAIPYLPKAGGGIYSADQLTYIWRLNGALLSNLGGRGKSSISLAAPTLYGTYSISVEVISPARDISGEAHTTVASIEPEVVLYQNHPLFGMEYWSALGATTFIAENEMTFSAVPYFADATSAEDHSLVYAWRVNGNKVAPDSTHPNNITFSAGQSGVVALLNLALTHARNYFLSAEGAWSITFTKGGGAKKDPFGSQ